MNDPNQEFYDQIAQTIINLNDEKARELVDQAIKQQKDLVGVIEHGFGKGMALIGEDFEKGNAFLPELMYAASIMQEAISKIKPLLKETRKEKIMKKIVMATVEGDIHSIGKDIVSTILSINGYDVKDLGVDVKLDKIVKAAEEFGADVIGLSSLLTTNMINQKILIQHLQEQGIRNKYKVILGGAVVTADWAKECQADGYAEDAFKAVQLVNSFFK